MSDESKRNEPCPCGSGKKYKKCCGRPGMAKHKAEVITAVSGKDSAISRIAHMGIMPFSNQGKTLSDKDVQIGLEPSGPAPEAKEPDLDKKTLEKD